MTRVDNAGVLTASGLIAGEAVLGLIWAGLQFAPKWARPQIFSEPSYLFGGMIVMFLLAILMIGLPLTAAGDPSEPAPPTAIMWHKMSGAGICGAGASPAGSSN